MLINNTMNTIKITGEINDENSILYADACLFFLKTLMPRKRKIEINVVFTADLMKTNLAYGECYHMKRNPSVFKVLIDSSLDYDSTLRILAHEFTHIQQFDSGKLKFGSTYSIWEGKIYMNEEDEPWEAEANGKEEFLYNLYKG